MNYIFYLGAVSCVAVFFTKTVTGRMVAKLIKNRLRYQILKILGYGYVIPINYFGDQFFRVDYTDGYNDYIFVSAINRGPTGIQNVKNAKGADITKEFLQMMGYGKNFHGMYATPKLFFTTKLTVKSTISTKEYNENDKIM
jgi:hypothetical protein